MPKYMPDCADCGAPITAANERRQHHANKKGEKMLMSTCRVCKRYQMRVLSRLRRQLPPPVSGTPCDCCGRVCRLQVDHDHQTGALRGLLCGSCNRGIGLLPGDSLEGVLLAAAYLSRGQGSSE